MRFRSLMAKCQKPVYLLRPLLISGRANFDKGIFLSILNNRDEKSIDISESINKLKELSIYACSPSWPIHATNPFFKIAKVQRCVNENISKNICLSSLAEEIGWSPSWLSYQFSEYSGINLIQYLLKIKFCYILWQIISTDIPLKIIARKIGYDDPLYFSKAFRRHFGLSPNSIRKQY